MYVELPRRPLSVLSVGYPFVPVGPDAVGGSEQVLSALDRALIAAGHRSIVVACAGSEVAGELVPVPAVGDTPIDERLRHSQHSAARACIEDVLRRRAIDLVHLHGLDFADYLPAADVPVLATLHLPPEWYPPQAIAPQRPGTRINCVSATQHRALLARLQSNGAQANSTPGWVLPPIGNGVDLEGLGAEPQSRRCYALMLGRICPEKGQHLAIDAARSAGVPLLLAGQMFQYADHIAYVEAEIRPRLGKGVRLIGPVRFARKRRLLSRARCLLLPSLAPETSSLVAMEAAACGTPVIAFGVGALPEIVEHGRTGFLVQDVAEMAAAIGRVDAIHPDYCRAVASRRFSLARTLAAYLNLYRALIDGRLQGVASLMAAG